MIPILAVLAAAPAGAALRLGLPVRCDLGSTCIVQKLPDHAPGPARADFRCGTLTTDAHDGTDFRIADEAAFRRGVPILAAAAGRVLRVRDGEPDVSIKQRGDTDGKDAGNGVVIDHGGGWITQYSHARRGSILVHPGQQVQAGQPIAMVGLSGNTEYPHLHFTLRRADRAIDPFTGGPVEQVCAQDGGTASLWAPPLPYTPTALVSVGFAAGTDDPGHPSRSELDPILATDKPLILWADVVGARPGDEQRFVISGPRGEQVLLSRAAVGSGGLTWFAFAGRKAPAGGWPAGRYKGRYELSRQARVLLRRDAAIDLVQSD